MVGCPACKKNVRQLDITTFEDYGKRYMCSKCHHQYVVYVTPDEKLREILKEMRWYSNEYDAISGYTVEEWAEQIERTLAWQPMDTLPEETRVLLYHTRDKIVVTGTRAKDRPDCIFTLQWNGNLYWDMENFSGWKWMPEGPK